ncbi:NCAM [Mytilus coruscus]|uniref:NCAM n=1 Tax=Mytilus coruscus TaxID=42192 RepID=A0A6J8D9L9_MYTCO|nr:NCAM [Mytilus coruscus]
MAVYVRLLMINILSFAYAQSDVYVVIEETVELKCPYPSTSTSTTWFGPQIVSPISKGSTLYWNTKDKRISINGNQSIGQYNLQISRIKTSDLGIYRCSVNIEDISYQHEFSVIQGRPPTDLKILNVQSDNTITGTEGKELTLQCGVISGIPRPLLEWMHNGKTLTENRTDVLNYTFIPKYSDHLVKIFLYLFCGDAPRVYFRNKEKPVRITEGNQLTIICNGNGYPNPNNFTWTKKTELSGNLISNLPSLYINNVKRTDAGKYACEAVNMIGTGRKEIDLLVMYAPGVDIQYKNYTDDTKTRRLICNATGIPSIYNFHDWEHTSDYGNHIRFLSGSNDGILYLPDNAKDSKYQDNGYYKCTVDNKIPDINGNIKQNAQVYLDVKGKPFFVIDNTDTVFGEYHQSFSVAVNIFSNPKYTTLEIFDRNGGDINSGPHLKVIEDYTSIIDAFRGTRVHVKGYRITIRIENLTDEYLTEYTFNVLNDFGQSQHRLSVLRASPPDTPFNNFFIEYRDQDSAIWIEVQAFNNTINAGTSWTVHNLKFGQSYIFRLFARNRIGESNKTSEMFVTINRSNGTRNDVEITACDDIQETNIDSDYGQPVDSLCIDRSVNVQLNVSSSNSESSENDIDENHTFTKDVIVNSYEQLTDDQEPPLPYDALNQ